MPVPAQPPHGAYGIPSEITLLFISAIVLLGGIATLLDSGNIIWHNRYRVPFGEILVVLGSVLVLVCLYRIKKYGVTFD